jgi:tetratricopeptide (TPR) repeat protein
VEAATAYQRYADLPGNPTRVEHPAPVPPPGPGPGPAAPAGPVAGPIPAAPVSAAPVGTDSRQRAHQLVAQGRLSQALELLGKDLDAALLRHSATHPEVVSQRLAILELQFRSQELQSAREGYLELAEVLTAAGSAPGRDLAVCRVMAARCLGRLGHNAAALAELRQAVALLNEVLPALHPHVLDARREIATLLAGSGSSAEALEMLRSLSVDQRAALPPDDPAHSEVEHLIIRLVRLTRTTHLVPDRTTTINIT